MYTVELLFETSVFIAEILVTEGFGSLHTSELQYVKDVKDIYDFQY